MINIAESVKRVGKVPASLYSVHPLQQAKRLFISMLQVLPAVVHTSQSDAVLSDNDKDVWKNLKDPSMEREGSVRSSSDKLSH